MVTRVFIVEVRETQASTKTDVAAWEKEGGHQGIKMTAIVGITDSGYLM
jgi:hypothetical protein